MKLTGQQRLVVALFLAAGIMFAYSTLIAPRLEKKKPAPPRLPATAAVAPATVAPPPPAPATAGTVAAPPTAVGTALPPAPTPGVPGLVKTGARAVVTTPLYKMTLQDGGLVALSLSAYPPDKDQVIFMRLDKAERPALAPFVTAGKAARWDVDRTALDLRGRERGGLTFTLREEGRVLATSSFTFRADDYEVAGKVAAGDASRPVRLSLGGFAARKGDDRMVGEISVDALVDRGKIRDKLGSKTEDKTYSGSIPWAALRSKYFILAVISDAGNELTMSRVKNESIAATYALARGGDYKIYVGPKRYFRLKEYKLGLERTVDLGPSLIGVLAVILLRMMAYINDLVGNYGLTIIILTVIIKILTYWPTAVSFKSSQKMQEIQPVLQQIREKYKSDPARQNTETMALYKKYKINPLGGCLPVLVIQFPILIALFNALRNDIELKGAPFMLWIKDLAEPDVLFKLPFTIPLVNISTLNVLPIVMIALWVLQNRMTLPGKGGVKNDQQKLMAYMPIIMGFFFYNMPSGLVLYWTVNTLLTLGQQLLMVKLSHRKEEVPA